MSEEKLTQQQIIALAAAEGARTALETVERERKKYATEIADRRLRNTKLLLRNYRTFLAYVDNAVYEVDEIESPEEIFRELMMPDRDGSVFVESIKKSVGRTKTIVKHIKLMMGLYESFCMNSSEEDMRRWRVINDLYIRDLNGQKQPSISEIAKLEGVVERTIYKDIDAACERIAALMFGIDGIKRK